jgi:hypothetical protein
MIQGPPRQLAMQAGVALLRNTLQGIEVDDGE